MFSDLVYRLRALFRRSDVESEMDDELRFHLERQVEKYVQSGMTPNDALRRARLEFGGEVQVREDCREARGVHWIETTFQDLGYGLRSLRKSPGFAAVAVITLALGIGATTAIFSVANPILFRPLPFRDPDRLMSVLENKAAQHLEWLYATQISYVEWKRRQTVFSSIAAVHGCGFRMPGEGQPHLLPGTCVSASFLPMLGVKPVLGRSWTEADDLPGRDHVALISYSTWQQEFGGDLNVVGKSIVRTGSGENISIIGVLPPDFQFVSDDTQVWAPVGINESSPTRFHDQYVFARLKPGVSQAQAQSSMDAIAAQLEKEYPVSNSGWGVTVQPIQRYYANLNNARPILLVLLAAVGALLLIACANVANLLLARASARQQEIAMRIALGASRMRLVRQLLTESLLLAVLGGAAGFVLARLGFSSLMALAPRLPTFSPSAIRIDLQVFTFALLASLLVSLLVGLAPALRASRTDSRELMHSAGRGVHTTFHNRSRNVLIVSEVGLVVALLMGCALLAQSLRNLANDRLGFATDHLLTMNFCCLDQVHYPTQADVTAFNRRLMQRLESLPGVETATASSTLPLRTFAGSGTPILIQGRPVPEAGHDELADARVVAPGYLATLRIPLLRGRDFAAQDDDLHTSVALINEAFVRRYFPDKEPLDQQVQIKNFQPFGRWFTVVGVIADSRERGLGEEVRPSVYISNYQSLFGGSALLIRTKADPLLIDANVRAAIRSLKSDAFIGRTSTLDALLSQSLAPQRFSVVLLTLFTALALTLAMVGVFGVISYMVARRTHEIGLRMALGAQRSDVVRLVVGHGLGLVLVGVAAGLAITLGTARLIDSLLYGVSASDPLTATSVAAALMLTALLACWFPARRAMRVDPMAALRCD
jgi:putative ABC transport system permease protein